jgi:small-conductance mechanosensitive channel
MLDRGGSRFGRSPKEREVNATLPPFFHEKLGSLWIWQWLGILLSLALGLALGLLIAYAIRRALESVVRRTPVPWDDAMARSIETPTRWGSTLIVSYLLMRALKLPGDWLEVLGVFTRACTIAAVVWASIRALYAVAQVVADESFVRDTVDPRRLAQARSLRTKIIVTTRVLSALLFILGAALVALQFAVVRSVGVSLLASAGVAGVALGFAAQKSLGALLAGIQISLSQPIRIGDSVLLQGEYGTIEDISLTYVTVKLWDERRMIVPTPRFLEEPFQNWSRSNIGLLGTVFLRVDFTCPMAKLRAEFERQMDHEPLWDGRVKHMQVTEMNTDMVEVRLLVTARDAPTLFDLRVSVREKLVAWLQELDGGRHLPRARLALQDAPARPTSDSAHSNGHSRSA